MAVFFLPQFITDLRSHMDGHFARRVLEKTILRNGTFREDGDDHRYRGTTNLWIRYISRRRSAYRVVFVRDGAHVYLYRAGEHKIENRLRSPSDDAFDHAMPVADDELGVADSVSRVSSFQTSEYERSTKLNRFLRNSPTPAINRAIFSRRNLPHRDIWLVSPYIKAELLLPTARLGKLLFDQLADGASILLITLPPKSQNITWLEQLQERDINVYFYPRLHSKLYCFVLDENRKYERGLPDPSRLSSLLLVGSANLTGKGLALTDGKYNEELCYALPDNEIDSIESYVTELITRGYDLREVRSMRARGQWNKLENDKW